ncbi:Membrane protein, partial [Lacticaseibacillus paracasei subsp. paracasei CNCM I-2877]
RPFVRTFSVTRDDAVCWHVRLLGYGALYFAYAPLMSSANNQIQGLLNPGIGFSVGIGAALVMFVTARLLPRD